MLAFARLDLFTLGRGLRDNICLEVSNGRDYGGLLIVITDRLDKILEQDKGHDEPTCPFLWGPINCATSTSDQARTVQITGPAPGDHFKATAASAAEASDSVRYVSALSAARKTKNSKENKLVSAFCASVSCRQKPEVTVDEHIQLLRQYNKTKDAGQMLIGLIADSRAVPVGSLYRDRDYGVSLDD
ncbi:hypothetical protein M406DRAFT_335013 [Cryphonectria parasitica EP155]|uniref:Uncharacterized protein n=1 Tax=Cryphonectria parasitica (strain ATCC 38755 / EP155) TaxID=660469 RepID=A0A9P4XT84_CRYP1|nr:uncharacterized protein M406DRAFT_335013 [Cryphonectria parasitica EP155]KAF3760345.1 hypothetical protein M406DRAFT_335013 [Cryphonectria parasitica EP155]